MKVVCILKHIEGEISGEAKGNKGRDAWWRLAGAGGQDGSFDSPGQGEPYNVGITYYESLNANLRLILFTWVSK